jgi:hypothetical protein
MTGVMRAAFMRRIAPRPGRYLLKACQNGGLLHTKFLQVITGFEKIDKNNQNNETISNFPCLSWNSKSSMMARAWRLTSFKPAAAPSRPGLWEHIRQGF